MNEGLQRFIEQLGCTVINPVKGTREDNFDIVAWHCKTSTTIKKHDTLTKIKTYFKRYYLDYYINDIENSTDFFIHKS